MALTHRDSAEITSYHAHIYYDDDTREIARSVRFGIEARFTCVLGRWHDSPVGPHPQSMYQVAFEPEIFSKIVPWLMLNRRGLAVLIHPNTGNAVEDHDIHPIWLGCKLELDITRLN